MERSNAEGLLALAFIHHLAIARNIPLGSLIDWLVGFAPQGVIEFVPKEDPMVQELLRLREDIFQGYSQEMFEKNIKKVAKIERAEKISESGRRLYWFNRL